MDIVSPDELTDEQRETGCALIAEQLDGRSVPPHNTVTEDDGSIWVEFRFTRNEVRHTLHIAPDLLLKRPEAELRTRIPWSDIAARLDASPEGATVRVTASDMMPCS